MDNSSRLYVYEVHMRTGPASHEFYCYAIYSSKTHHVIQMFKHKSQRAARKLCEKFVGNLIFQDEVPIVIYRNWPILLWPDELSEQELIKKICKKEVKI